MSSRNVLVAVCVFPAVSFAVIVMEYVPSAIVELVKFHELYVPVLVPNLVSLIVILSEFVSEAVPKIDIVETERLAPTAGEDIESVGDVVSTPIFATVIVVFWFPESSVALILNV